MYTKGKSFWLGVFLSKRSFLNTALTVILMFTWALVNGQARDFNGVINPTQPEERGVATRLFDCTEIQLSMLV